MSENKNEGLQLSIGNSGQGGCIERMVSGFWMNGRLIRFR